MTIREHMDRTFLLLGDEAAEVHLFLDSYFPLWPTSAHRVLLHHAMGIALAEKRFGDVGARAAAVHVMDDFGFIPAGPAEVAELVPIYPSQSHGIILELEVLYGTDFGIEES